MAIIKAPDKINKSTQEMGNLSFDTEFNLNAAENLVYNPTTCEIDREVQPGTETTQLILKGLIETLNTNLNLIASLAEAKGVAADLRATLLSGTLTTCNTVSNLNQLAGVTALVPMANWQNTIAIQSNINNVATE